MRTVNSDRALKYHPAHPYDMQFNQDQSTLFGIRYLQQFITTSTPLPEVVAAYFEDRWKLERAKIRAKSDSVIPKSMEQNSGYTVDKGYGIELKPEVRDLIYRTLALYYITDETGKVHFEVLDSNNRPIKGLAER